MVAAFLFNLFCALVTCDPYFKPPTPTPKPCLENLGMEFPVRRNLDLKSGLHLQNLTKIERPPPLVETQSGTVEGYFMKVINGRKIYAFEGIPFAEPPQGNLRFRPPIPKKRWKGIRQAKKPGNLCTQMHPVKMYRVVGDEDCLTISVFSPKITTPDNNPNLSVMVWIHGGSFMYEDVSDYGPAYILQKDIVLVMMNYRLGVLGFLSTGNEENPGNWGLKDQAMAIKWVANNIGAFGGNRNSITLAGQSAGATAVHLHMMSNLSKHLFHRAISMSGSAMVMWAVHTQHQARKWAEKLAKFVGCPRGPKDMMDCFRSRDPNFLVANQINLFTIIGVPPVLFRPVIEPDLPGAFLTMSPMEAYEQNQVAKIPYIASNTDSETDLLAIMLRTTGFLRLWLSFPGELCPILLDFGRVAKNATAVTRAVADFYFKGQDLRILAKSSGVVYTRVGSDRYFYTGNRKTLKYHSKIAPTYSYIWSYKNPYGYVQYTGLRTDDYGVSHTEDLPFLLNTSVYFESFKGTEKGYAFSELLVSLFTNFVIKGEPLATDKAGVDHRIWEPVTNPMKPMFLQIDQEVKMIPDPRKRELEFWERLGLDDMYPYQYA